MKIAPLVSHKIDIKKNNKKNSFGGNIFCTVNNRATDTVAVDLMRVGAALRKELRDSLTGVDDLNVKGHRCFRFGYAAPTFYERVFEIIDAIKGSHPNIVFLVEL